MNRLITTHVNYRGSLVSVDQLKQNSNIKVEVECDHGRRFVRWSRRHQLCRRCAANLGIYNTSKPGRKITWGRNISKVKKGVKFTKEHKDALVNARKRKLAKIQNKPEHEVIFPTRSYQYKIRLFMMGALSKSPLRTSLKKQDELFKKYLNYSLNDFIAYLESKFQPGMTWENYGQWHIDHIKPESWFNYNSFEDEQFKECWSLSNLQPLWAEQNLKKNNLYSGKFKERKIYFLCGQSGVGKSTVAAKLDEYFTILNKDDFRTIKALDKAISSNWFNDKPILLQIGFHISSTIKRYTNKGYEVVPFFIIEEPSVVCERIKLRGGSRIDNVEDRYKRITSLASKVSVMSCKADDMVQYLLKYGQETFRNRHDSGVST